MPTNRRKRSKPESLSDQAYRIVEEMIVTLKLEPGQVFSEIELSAAIGIGRTPLREALQRLAEYQLVVTMPRRGIRVSEVDIRQMLAILETRRVLDRLMASRAARRANDAVKIPLRILSEDMDTASATGDLERFLRIDREIDVLLAEASENEFASKAVEPLHMHCRRFWYANKNAGDIKQSAKLHQELVQAVLNGDEERASQAADAILDYLEVFARKPLNSF